MKIPKLSAAILLIIFLSAQCIDKKDSADIKGQDIFIASWNVENLFDTKNNPEKKDEWFTPESEINWNREKLKQKIGNLAKVIEYMNEGLGPDIIGLQEVENSAPLEELVKKISLYRDYRIVHYESPDVRGIDNALIYDADKLNLEKSYAISIVLDENKTTRDILYCRLSNSNSKLHIYVNHWPSRREGLKKTEKRRITSSKTLKEHILSLDSPERKNIIVMGDFNDLPANISIKQVLKAEDLDCRNTQSDTLSFYNTAFEKFQSGEGTYKYKDNWNMLDQIIVSNSLVDKQGIDYVCDSFNIFKPEFLLQKDGKYKGTSLPTYGGRKYLGGFSDHFAVSLKLTIIAE